VTRAVEVSRLVRRLVGGEERLAGVHVRVLAAVRLSLGPVGVAVAPEESPVVAEPVVDQLSGRVEVALGALDPGVDRAGVRQ